MTKTEKQARLSEIEKEKAAVKMRLKDALALQVEAEIALGNAKATVKDAQSQQVELTAEELRLLRGLK